MILEFVTFPTPPGQTRDQEYDGARHSAAAWVKNSELVAKHFIRDGEGTSGATYIWPSVEAAKRGHNEAWLAEFRKRNGCDPVIRYFELMMTADAKAGKVVEYGEEMQAAE
ncbi:MAG: hypothetical protein KDJ29_13230 [Hyphomicrobiales bacterium]|nr:hypothetical protein [Hyphomicrobiales bacterium]